MRDLLVKVNINAWHHLKKKKKKLLTYFNKYCEISQLTCTSRITKISAGRKRIKLDVQAKEKHLTFVCLGHAVTFGCSIFNLHVIFYQKCFLLFKKVIYILRRKKKRGGMSWIIKINKRNTTLMILNTIL